MHAIFRRGFLSLRGQPSDGIRFHEKFLKTWCSYNNESLQIPNHHKVRYTYRHHLCSFVLMEWLICGRKTAQMQQDDKGIVILIL